MRRERIWRTSLSTYFHRRHTKIHPKHFEPRPAVWRPATRAGLLATLLVGFPIFAAAGPEGHVAPAALGTPIARIFLGLLIVLVVRRLYVQLRLATEARRTLEDLTELAWSYPYFAWPRIADRVQETMQALSEAWAAEDLEGARSYMTRELFVGQRKRLANWKSEGKHFTFELRSLKKLSPLFLAVENERSYSRVSVLVEGQVLRTLKDSEGNILRGGSQPQAYRSVWSFAYEEGADAWLLYSIESDAESLAVALHPNRTDTTWIDSERQTLEITSSHMDALRVAVGRQPLRDLRVG